MTGTAVEQVEAQDLAARNAVSRTLATANVLAASSLLRADLRGKVDDVRAIAITLHQLGVPPTIPNMNLAYVVKGRVEFEVRLWTALAARAGHEVWVDADHEGATAYLRRSDSGRTYSVTFTWDDAVRAGLNLTRTKEGKIVDSETYKKFPTDMLAWRALGRVVKRYAPEVVAGMVDAGEQTVSHPRPRPLPIDQPEQDDDIADAEIVEQGEDPGLRPTQMSAGAEKNEASSSSHSALGDSAARPGPTAPAGSSDEQPEVYLKRQKRANAVMGEVGVKADDARHQLVHTATGGATESTGRLTAWQVEAIVAFCDRLKADEGDGSGEAGENEDDDRGASAAPLPPGPVPGEWRARAAELGVTDGQLLIMARDVAGALGVAPPTALKNISDEVAAGVLERLA